MSPRLVAPCLGCNDRTIEPNCHTSCEKYLEYVNLKQELKNKRHEVINIDRYEGAFASRMHQYKVKKDKNK